MSYATEPLMENTQRSDGFILIALLLSIALHGSAIGLLPGFGKSPAPLTPPPLTIELVTPEVPPPPPPPVKAPEPPKPQTKPEPKPVAVSPQPKPAPVQKTQSPEPPSATPAHTEPPTTPAPEATKPAEPTPPPMMAVEQKSIESPPTFTSPIPVPTPQPQNEPINSSDEDDSDTDGFGQAMADELKKNVKYPAVARKEGWEGVVTITYHIDKEGNISDITIKKKSRYKMLDTNALETARKTKLLPIPPSKRGKAFSRSIRVIYRLED